MSQSSEFDDIILDIDGITDPSQVVVATTLPGGGIDLLPGPYVKEAQKLWSLHFGPIRGTYQERVDKGCKRAAVKDGTVGSLREKRRRGASELLVGALTDFG